MRDFKRITRDLGRILEENDPEVGKAMETFVLEAERSAEEHGPGSEAAQRYRLFAVPGVARPAVPLASSAGGGFRLPGAFLWPRIPPSKRAIS